MATLMGAVRTNVAAGMKQSDAQIAAVESALTEARADLQEISQAIADARPAAPKSGMDAAAEAMKESAAAIREMAAAVKESVKPVAESPRADYAITKSIPYFRPALSADIKALRIPPAWTDVYINVDPNASLVAIGADKKGRQQYLYSAEHTASALIEKFKRQREFNNALPALMDRINRDADAGNEEAAVLRLIAHSGFRVGSDEIRGDVEAFGGTTLRPNHISVDGNTVHFDFPGKRGIQQVHSVQNTDVARDIAERIARGNDKIYATNDAKVRRYLHSISEADFKVHDFRTWNATDAARQAMAGMAAPETAQEFWGARDAVGDIAARKIGDTRSVALDSYVDPLIFDGWRVYAGVSENAERPRRAAKRVDRSAGEKNAGPLRDAPFREQESSGLAEAAQPKPAYNPAQLDLIYDHIETRSGTTPEQKSTGIAALRALFGGDRRAGASILGSALWKNFQARAGSELIGQKAESSADLAVAAQILRDPRFETLRVFFTQNGKIVGHTGWTSRLPGAVAFDVAGRTVDIGLGRDGFGERISQLEAQMKAAGADGYYLLHNHPSGSARPSSADLRLTQHVAYEMPGFKGHVVIDHNEYSEISAQGKGVTHPLPEGHRQKTAEPELMHDVLFDKINGAPALVSVAKKLQARSGYATLISTNGENEIIALAEVPETLLVGGTPYKDLKAIARVRRFQVMTGSAGRTFLVASNAPAQFKTLVERGAITDIVASYGGETMREALPNLVGRNHADFGRGVKMVAEAQQTVAPYWTESLPQAQKDALQKAGVITEEKTLGERIKEMATTFSSSFKQGLFDQFAPIKELDYRAYMLARMSRGSDGGLEAMMLYGKPYLDGGALNVRMENGGLTKVFQGLQGEHDRFLAWIAGNRAAQLRSEGRENLFTNDDISALKDLNTGMMPDGQRREALYDATQKEFQAYQNAILDIAEQQGLIDRESRAVWAQDFYVPFYRAIEGGAGPTIKSGLTNQYAFKKLKGGKENLKDLMANTLMNWSHLLSASMKNKAALTALESAVQVGGAIEVPSTYMAKQMQLGTDVVKVLDEGVHRYFMVADPFMLDAITAMEWSGFKGPVMDAMAKFKRALSTGVTVNPTYKIRNLMRDTVSAIAQGDLSYNAAKNLAQGWRLTAADSPVRASMMAGGALMRFGAVLEGDSAARTKRLIDAGVDQNTVLDTPGKVKAMMEKAWTAYQELGDRGEQVNRAALYQQLRDRGLSHLEASFQARDLMDFSMQGKWATIRMIGQAVPFFNARLQGLYKLGRAAAEDPARMGYVVGALSLASMSLLLWNHDDDDWKKREDWDRDQYWWFKVGDTAYRVPKPFEIGAVASVAERSLEYLISDERDPGHRFLKSVGNMISNNLSMNPVPQMVKPLIDLYANQDSFTGRKIETEGMQNLSKGERVGPGTSLPAQLLGKLDPTDSLSPVQIDFLARAYFGWLGTAAVTAVDYGMRPLTDLPPKPAAQLRQFPVVGNFMEGLPANQSRYVTLFYDEAKKIDEAYADYRNALKLGNREKAADLMADKGELIRQESSTARARRAIGALNQQERMVELNRELDPTAKRVLVDAIAKKRDELARSVVTR